ncbi:MAG TPA: hypothetical protein VLM85_10980 [Polyangiaceae bacterium]|nr:hypothetical protein [Polyangiaceae bacterium]
MRRTTLVIGIGLLLTTGCYARSRHAGYYGYYGGGAYSSSYGSTGVVYNQPQPVPPPPQAQGQVVVQQPGVAGEGISGSDGTRGWRVVSQAPTNDLQHIVQLAGRASCQVEGMNNFEFRGSCTGNVHVIVRVDQQNVYKLCAPGTDPNACAQVWGLIGN